MIYVLYVVLLAALVFLSIKLGDLVDLLDKKTSISGAFIGGVLLAAVTSLPELFTSSTAVFLNDETSIQLVMGNILGSNIFNMLVLGIGVVIFYKGFKSGKLNSWHLVLLSVTLGFNALIAIANFFPEFTAGLQLSFKGYGEKQFGNFNLIGLIIIIAYAIAVAKQPKEDEGEEEEEKVDNSKLSLKAVIILFIVCSLALIGASIGITYVTDIVAENLHLGKTVAGAIFLGIATSIPELMSCLTLMKKKNFDAAWGDITGSCCFNFIIVGIADFLSVKETVFIPSADVTLFLICTLVSWAALFTITLIKIKKDELNNKKWAFVIIPLGVLLVVSYLCSIILNICL